MVLTHLPNEGEKTLSNFDRFRGNCLDDVYSFWLQKHSVCLETSWLSVVSVVDNGVGVMSFINIGGNVSEALPNRTNSSIRGARDLNLKKGANSYE